MTQSGDMVYTPNNFVNAIQELPVFLLQKINLMYTKSLIVCFFAYFSQSYLVIFL